jgi:hypothetical protein
MGQLFSLLLLVGFVGAYFKWIALAVAAWFTYRWGRAAWARHCADADAWAVEQKAIAARADQQHAWVMAGEDRGVYGEVGRALNATPSRLRTESH